MRPGQVMLASFLALALALGLAGAARADVPPEPGEGGNCIGNTGVICQRALSGQQVTGICYESRFGTPFCSIDQGSQEKAAAILAARAERSRKETIAVVIVAAVCGLVLVGVITSARRKRRREPPP